MVLVLAAVLPLAALSVWFAAREVDRSAERAQVQLRFTATAVAAYQDRLIDSVHHLLGTIAAMPQVRAPDCGAHLAALQQRFPIYANLGMTDATGQVTCLARGDIGTGDASDRLYFRRALEHRTFVMGEAVIGRATGIRSLAFALPLLEGDTVVAVVFAALDLQRADAALRELDLPPGARITIAQSSGRALLVHPPVNGRAPGEPISVAALREVANRMEAGTGQFVGADGQQRIYAAAPVTGVAGERLIAIVTQDRALLTHGAGLHLGVVLAATLLCLLAGLAAAWWIGGRVIVKPAKQILGTVRRLEQGRLDARVPMAERNPRGELGRIGAAFNLMAESLQQRQQDLQIELGRSRGAYAVLETVLNGMQEGLIAVSADGQFLMVNRAAHALFDTEHAGPPEAWPSHFGLYYRDGSRLVDLQDMPLARGMRGEQGEVVMMVRNARTPEPRLLRGSFRPLQAEGGGASGALVVFTDVTDLEKAEADLVLLRNAVARLNDIVLITEARPIDEPGPRIVFVNEAFERLTGYTAREALGNTPRMLQGPATERAALDRIRAALAQGLPVREELENRAKDGRAFWVELDIVPLANEQGQYTHWIAVERDITARKQFEQALLASERELQDFSAMLQRTAEAAQAVARHRTLEATVQEVRGQACRVLAAQRCELVLDAGAAAPLRRDGHALTVPLVGGNGETIGRMDLRRVAGAAFGEREEYVAIELAQLAATAIENVRLFQQVRELNAGLESRIAERTAELARQEKRYRALAEQAPEVVWNVDPSGQMTFVNRAWYELVGGQPPEWLGHGWASRVHVDDLPQMRQRWERSRETLEPYMGTRRVLARDGSWHTMAYRAAPVLDEHGQVEFWVGIDSDITELKAIEEALRVSNQELEAFSYSVSHDLRAPLGAIDGFSKALEQKLGAQADEKAQHYLARVRAGVGKMEQLIDAMLALSRVARSPLARGAVDLSAIARETLEGLQMQQPDRAVDVCIDDGLVVQGDASLLRVAMENLLGNAWKFTSKLPQARIEVGRDEDSGAIYVRDNGVGFDMAYAGKLFGAFQRLHTDAEFPGTGIGLATVRRVVGRHQGRVWAQSQPGEGTTFFFTLP